MAAMGNLGETLGHLLQRVPLARPSGNDKAGAGLCVEQLHGFGKTRSTPALVRPETHRNHRNSRSVGEISPVGVVLGWGLEPG